MLRVCTKITRDKHKSRKADMDLLHEHSPLCRCDALPCLTQEQTALERWRGAGARA